MPASKKPTNKKRPTGARPAPSRRARADFSPEYEEYLERYAEFGEGRPRLSPEEFDKLDDELLDLLNLAGERLTDDQMIRVQELEYLLIDSE